MSSPFQSTTWGSLSKGEGLSSVTACGPAEGGNGEKVLLLAEIRLHRI